MPGCHEEDDMNHYSVSEHPDIWSRSSGVLKQKHSLGVSSQDISHPWWWRITRSRSRSRSGVFTRSICQNWRSFSDDSQMVFMSSSELEVQPTTGSSCLTRSNAGNRPQLNPVPRVKVLRHRHVTIPITWKTSSGASQQIHSPSACEYLKPWSWFFSSNSHSSVGHFVPHLQFQPSY